MSEIHYHIASVDEVHALVKIRIDCLSEILTRKSDAGLRTTLEMTTQFFLESMKKEQLVGCLGTVEENIACGACLIVYFLPPKLNAKPRKYAIVQNFYTYPEYRKNGYGKGLLNFTIQAARERRIRRLILHSTPVGEILYKNAGFISPDTHEMILEL